MKKIIASLTLVAALSFGTAFAEQPARSPFVPLEPIMTLSQVKPGMKAQVKTVIEGTEIKQFAATLLGVVPRKTQPSNLIVIRIDDQYVRDNGGIAAGMSGSPVYVDGKLVGAIGYGWAFGDSSLGLVTPIEEMIKVMDWPDRIPAMGRAQKIRTEEPKTEPASGDIAASEIKSGDKTPGVPDGGALSGDECDDDIFIDSGHKEEIISNDISSEDLDKFLQSIREELSSDVKPASGDKPENGGKSENDVKPGNGDAGKEDKAGGEDKFLLNFPENLRGDIAKLSTVELTPLSMPLIVDGISVRMSERLKQKLGTEVIPLGSASDSGSVNMKAALKPGSAIGASLAWGDFSAGGIGTLTALDKSGRFLAFGHAMSSKGAVAYAATEAQIVKIIPSLNTSFKLGYQGPIVGIVTQDRPAAIGGYMSRLAPATSYTVKFHDVDEGKIVVKHFQTVADPFIGPELGATGMLGIIDDLWSRIGEGTAMVRYNFSGGHMVEGWKRNNIYFSEGDIVSEMMSEFATLSKIFALNQFQEIRPFGVEVAVEITRDPRVVYIEKIKIVNEKEYYSPGDTIDIAVTLRPWRKPSKVNQLSLKVPDNAIGLCEIVVRGGGINELGQDSIMAGYRTITNLADLIKELNVEESNNQLILEIKSDGDLFAPRKSKAKSASKNAKSDGDSADTAADKGKDKENDKPSIDDFMDDRMKSEIIDERLEEQSMLILETNYYVEGLLRKYIAINSKGGSNMTLEELLEEARIEEELVEAEYDEAGYAEPEEDAIIRGMPGRSFQRPFLKK